MHPPSASSDMTHYHALKAKGNLDAAAVIKKLNRYKGL